MENYNNWINFNTNISELKDFNDASNLLKHILHNQNRKNEPEKINKNPALPNAFINLKKTNLNDYMKHCSKLKKGGKGAKPFRFITTTLNIEPTKENEKIINEWANKMFQLYSKYFNIEGAGLHLNETRPHLHIVAKNFNDKEWGNFVNGKKIKLSGYEGKKILQKIWEEGEEINREIAKKYGVNFLQQPTTEKGENRKINQFRKRLEKNPADIVAGAQLQEIANAKTPATAENEKIEKTEGWTKAVRMLTELARKAGITCRGGNIMTTADILNFLGNDKAREKLFNSLLNHTVNKQEFQELKKIRSTLKQVVAETNEPEPIQVKEVKKDTEKGISAPVRTR